MGSFGENLRRERELRGITLVELSNVTRINRKYLVALEDDQFHQLPGGVFIRGFVRAIASYMKLDEHHWIGEYARAAGEEAEVLARYSPPRPPAPNSISRRVWSLVVLVAVFGAGAYLVHQVRMQRAAEAAARTATAQTPTISQPPASAELPPAPAAEAAPSTTELRLQIDTLEDAQVTVTVDGQPAFQGRMGPGETRTFRAGREIEMSTNNAAAVVLTLNGKTLAPLGNPGEIKQVTLTAKDLL